MDEYLQASRQQTIEALSWQFAALSNILPEAVFRCGGAFVRVQHPEQSLTAMARKAKPSVWKRHLRSNRPKRLASLAGAYRKQLNASEKLTLVHIGDGRHQYTLRKELKDELAGADIGLKFFVVDPKVSNLPKAKNRYNSIFGSWRELLEALHDFILKQKDNTHVLITLSLDRTLIYPIDGDEDGFTGFVSESLERFVSSYSISDVRAMAVPTAIDIVESKFKPYKDLGDFQEDYDLLALCVLSLVAGIFDPEEIEAYPSFRKNFFPDFCARACNRRWGVASIRDAAGAHSHFISQHQYWRVDEVAMLADEMKSRLAKKQTFNTAFRLAQNSVLLEKLEGGADVLNKSLLRQLVLLMRKHPKILVVGFSDMPMASIGLERDAQGWARALPGRNSVFFTKMQVI